MSYFDDASLVMIPSGYKDQKVYSVKPIDGSGDLTFSRASSATRVNSLGLVEKVRENVLLRSNSFTTSPFTSSNISLAGGQSGYDGTSNAWLMTKLNAFGSVFQTSIAVATSTPYTFSCYMKANASGSGSLRLFTNATGFDFRVVFNLTTGAIATASANNGTRLGASATEVGNGWWRVSVSGLTNGTAATVNIYAGDTADVSGSIYIQDAMVEIGDVMTDYIATTSSAVSVGPVSGLPRLDYSGGASCPSLLLEPQRTNYAPYSSQFNQWSDALGCDIYANTSVSPDGYTNADTLSFGGAADSRAFQSVSFSSATYTFSVYAKSSTGKKFRFRISDSVGTQYSADLTTSSTWQRFTYQFTGDPTAIALTNEASAAGGSIEVYGFQAEIGAYETSLIPTLSTAVTRVGDAASKTGISSLIGQTEGTLFFEGSQNLPQTCVPFQLSDTTNANRVQIEIGGTTAPLCVVTSGGTTQAVIAGSTYTLGQNRKIAVTYKANEFKLYQNGVLIGTDTSGSVPISLSAIYVGSESGTPYVGFDVKQILHFKTALSSADAITLTTL